MPNFSERMGLKKASQTIQTDGMDQALRNALWNALTILFFPPGGETVPINSNSTLFRAARVLWASYFKQPLDTIPQWWGEARTIIRRNFFGYPWNEVYDFIEFCSEALIADAAERKRLQVLCNQALEGNQAGYRMTAGKFIANTAKHELETIDAAQAAKGKFSPVADHIQKALEHLSRRENPDYRNSIKESISAVEAACCIIADDQKATLGQALKKLEEQGFPIHKAQKDAFSKLYGYTSNAEGIRHALLDEPTLTYGDAQFMLVTCSAFVNYLIVLANAAKPTRR